MAKAAYTFTEEFCEKAIFLDSGAEFMYSSDQAYIDYPCRFATVDFELCATNELIKLADEIRESEGYKPMLPTEKHIDDYDTEGWYDFYISINDFGDTRIDNSIQFVVVNSDSEDNESMYLIDLTEAEQYAIYNRLSEQAEEVYGKSCNELLAESAAELVDQIRIEKEI